jgi:preprotein translocase subunit SecG
MMILFWLLLVIFIIVCILLCFLVLIQSDKGGGISGAIGGGLGGANSLLGTQDTANILTRGSVIFGAAFLVLCVVMSIVMSHQTITVEKSILQKRAEKQQAFSPSSALNNGGGMPIKSSGVQGSNQEAPAAQTPGLHIKQPVQSGSTSKPGAAPKPVPAGALPIGPSQGGPEK